MTTSSSTTASLGIEAYGGFKLSDNLSLEVSLRSDDAVDLNDIAGSASTPPRHQ